VTWVKFPSLESNPVLRAGRGSTSRSGAGAVFSFGIQGGYEAGRKFIDRVKLFSHLANVGDARSLVIPPLFDHAPAAQPGGTGSGRLDAGHGAAVPSASKTWMTFSGISTRRWRRRTIAADAPTGLAAVRRCA